MWAIFFIPTSDDIPTESAVEARTQRQADMGVNEFILRPCADELDQLELLGEIAARVA